MAQENLTAGLGHWVRIRGTGIRVLLFMVLLLNTGLAQTSSGFEKDFSTQFDALFSSWQVRQSYQWRGKTPPSGNPAYSAPRPSLQDYQAKIRTIDSRFPLYCDARVKAFIELMTRSKRRSTGIMLGLAKEYFPFIERELVWRGLPDELKYIPTTLSALDPVYVRPGKGSGMWQLAYHPGLRYGLKINERVDERKMHQHATQAAIRYLEDLYPLYEDWLLTLAAFQSSPAAVNRALKKTNGERDFASLYPHLPEDSRDFVPAFIATLHVFSHAAEYDLHAEPMNLTYPLDTVISGKALHLEAVADLLDIPSLELKAINPVLCSDLLDPADWEQLILPKGSAAAFFLKQDSILSLSDSLFRRDGLVPNPSPLPRNWPVKTAPSPFTHPKYRRF